MAGERPEFHKLITLDDEMTALNGLINAEMAAKDEELRTAQLLRVMEEREQAQNYLIGFGNVSEERLSKIRDVSQAGEITMHTASKVLMLASARRPEDDNSERIFETDTTKITLQTTQDNPRITGKVFEKLTPETTNPKQVLLIEMPLDDELINQHTMKGWRQQPGKPVTMIEPFDILGKPKGPGSQLQYMLLLKSFVKHFNDVLADEDNRLAQTA